jgi:serine protease Do
VRGRLGVTVQNVTADMASSLGLSEVGGAIVSRVESGSAAEKAGIERGDVIVAIGGEPVADNNELRNRIASTRPGTPTKLDVLRHGKRTTVTATIDRLTPESTEAAAGDSRRESGGYGMTVEPLTPETTRSLQLPRGTEGVVIREVAPDGAAAAAGLEAGDVIMQVNGQAVTSGADVKAALEKASGKPSLLLVSRRGTEVFVTIRSNS